jgi:heme-binding protein
MASAQPQPPNCTAADLAGVASGVSAATSAYLFTHPDVNFFFTSLEGVPREDVRDDVQNYLNQNPQAKADLTGIRQPLVDLKNRCGDTNGDGIADS